MILYRNKERREHYERKNLLQCRRHCKDARCEYGKILHDFAGNEQGTGWKRFPYNRRQNSGGAFSREMVWRSQGGECMSCSAKRDPNGTWHIQYRWTDWTGTKKKSQKRGFKTKKEAEE